MSTASFVGAKTSGSHPLQTGVGSHDGLKSSPQFMIHTQFLYEFLSASALSLTLSADQLHPAPVCTPLLMGAGLFPKGTSEGSGSSTELTPLCLPELVLVTFS